MSAIHIPRRSKVSFREIAMLIIALLSLGVIFVRLWYLQVVKASELSDRAATLRSNSVSKLAPRGLIEDSKGNILAGILSELVVKAIPAELNKNPEALNKLAQALGVSPESISEKLLPERTRPFLPTPVAVGVPVETAIRVAEEWEELPGVNVESQPMRYYPDSKSFAHIVGYVGTPTDKDVARLGKDGTKAADFVGKTGLEFTYEHQLMGIPGQDSVEVDAKGKPLRIIDEHAPTAGSRLELSLDSDLQHIALRELSDVLGKEPGSGGAVVALDPNTGEVLCLASSPTYDGAMFVGGISKEQYSQLSNDPGKPLFNRATRGAYSPGSTFKIVTTLAAKKAGTFDPNRVVYCPGYYKVGNRKVKCLGVHGAIRFRDALIRSCNTYFSDLAVRTGPDAIRDQATEMGFGQRSGIDLYGEGKAVVPTDDWLRAVKKLPKDQKPPWYPGDTVNLGIGQGEMAATPLQMADLMSAVANRGVCYRPHLVRAIVPPSPGIRTSIAPEQLFRISAPDDIWDRLQDAMIGVVATGTARRAQIPGVEWAGKTGSAEHSGPNKKTHSWFVGYAPAQNPVIAICVLVEQAGHGGEIAAPIAAKVVKRYLEERSILPSADSSSR